MPNHGPAHQTPRKKRSILSLRRDKDKLASAPSETYYSLPIPPPFSPNSSAEKSKSYSPQISVAQAFSSHQENEGRQYRGTTSDETDPDTGDLVYASTNSEKTVKRAASTSADSFTFPSLDEMYGFDGVGPPTPRIGTRSRSSTTLSLKPTWDDIFSSNSSRFSGSSGQTQSETPPQTPVDIFYRRSRDRYPVVVAAPIAGVETMDALVDGMNGFSTEDLHSNGALASGRSGFGIPGHHPLYTPPLPTPPPGVVLGGGKARKLRKPPLAQENSGDEDIDDSEDTTTLASRPRRRGDRAAIARAASNSTITTVCPSSLSTDRSKSPARPQIFVEDPIKSFMPSQFDDPHKTLVPSISEIIRAHAPAATQTRSRPGTASTRPSTATTMTRPSTATRPPPASRPPTRPSTATSGRPSTATTARSSTFTRYSQGEVVEEYSEPESEPATADEDTDLVSRSSVDSITAEVQMTIKAQKNLSSPQPPLQHAHSFPSRHSMSSDRVSARYTIADVGPEPSIYSSSAASSQRPPSPFDSPILAAINQSPSQEIAQYLRSARLTKLLQLTRSPHASREHPLTVSLSDLGSLDGLPLVVFLGLGAVRHVMGLYDEMAECLNLRLITIDRWGLGRTGEAWSKSSRGIMEWASVVEEVLDLLHIDQCSVMAHSAGAPYALSFANRVPERIVGDVCLLAPWVGGSESGGYKWLKYVPNGILKTAQAAEWKLQAWMIGKPPTLAFQGIGFDAHSPTSSNAVLKSPRKPWIGRPDSRASIPYAYLNSDPRPSIGSQSFVSSNFSDYDKLSDFEGRLESRSTLGPRRDFPTSGIPSESNDPKKKRKPSRGFLGKLKGSSNVQDQSQTQSQPGSDSPNPSSGKKLRGLRSMSSLKGGKSSNSTPETKKAERSPRLPQPLTFDGLGINELDWPKTIVTVDPVTPSKHPSAERPSTSDRYSAVPGSRTNGRRSISFTAASRSSHASSPLHSPSLNGGSRVSYQAMLGNALIAASHAEASKGTHSDLLQILNHDHQPWGFSYASYPHRVRVWYGDRDEKIAEHAVRWMERNMGEERCSVKVVKGADHSLMYNSSVVVEVMESLREFW